MTSTANGVAPASDINEISRALSVLYPVGTPVELRLPNGKRPSGGYFDDHDALAQAAAKVNGCNAYVTMNRIDPALLARRQNRVDYADQTTSDANILRREWLLVDLDHARPAGISATDAEHYAAIDLAYRVAHWLHSYFDWPEPVVADSGNGAHLLYKIDLPNDADSTKLVQRVLVRLGHEFDQPGAVHVDLSVFNASRITKLYGTVSRKGDHTHDRPHRLSKLLAVPEPVQVVTAEQLQEFAGPPEPEPERQPQHRLDGSRFDLDAFIGRHLDVSAAGDYSNPNGAEYRWRLSTCPLCGESDGSAVVLKFRDGRIGYRCHHNRCTGRGWSDLREHFEPGYRDAREQYRGNGYSEGFDFGDNPKPPARTVEKFTIGELLELHPRLNPAVIEGLCRQGETVNLISMSKVGKSWLAYNLALSIITGRPWLDRFETYCGRVLLIDNELHKSTLAHRVPLVAEAMGIEPHDYIGELDVWPLRGNLQSLQQLAGELEEISPLHYRAIIFDAKYRFAEPGVPENENGADTQVYNLLDRIADKTKSTLVLVHHTSKGDQSGKRVTDVGAGAGAQSRAADCHLVLREHEEPGVVVLDAAVRSFAPIEPVPLRWEFPLWRPDGFLDASKLKGRLSGGEQRQAEKDNEAMTEIATALLTGPATTRKLRTATGFSRDRMERLIGLMLKRGTIFATETDANGNATNEYTLAPTEGVVD